MANVHEYALTLGIDGTLIPIKAVVKLTQTYERAGGRNLLRMRSGRGVMQSRWEKVRSDIAATGWIPAPLAALDQTVPHVLDCAAPRAVPVGTVVNERPDIPGVVRNGMYYYWPRLTGFITIAENTDIRSASWGWNLHFEEQ